MKKRPVYFWIELNTNGFSSTIFISSGPESHNLGKENMAEWTTKPQAAYLEKCCKGLGLHVETFGSENSHEVSLPSENEAWSLSALLSKKWIRLGTDSFSDGTEACAF